ncbi:MAG: glycosyltransferase [Chloroflexota bacterium]
MMDNRLAPCADWFHNGRAGILGVAAPAWNTEFTVRVLGGEVAVLARFLFVSWAGGGNEPPAVGIAQELQRRGHAVAFVGQDLGSQTTVTRSMGFRFDYLLRASAVWDGARRDSRLIAAVMACSAHLQDIPDAVRRDRPDVLVIDCLMFGALAAAEVLSLPTAVLVHSPPGATAPPGGMRERALLAPVNQVRDIAGLPAAARLWDAWASFPSLCVTIPELDERATDVPSSFEYVGPVFPRVPPSGWRMPWSSDDARPLIVVSFSTTSGIDQSSRVGRTLDALAESEYRVLVTTGSVDPASLHVPSNAVVVRHVPHVEIIPSAAALVTHAGHGTVVAALAHGVPLVCLPNAARDQPELARRVAELAAGCALDGDEASPADIAAAIELVLRDGSYAAQARRLAAIIGAAPGAPAAASHLERLARGEG